jgi:malate permease and related proteins
MEAFAAIASKVVGVFLVMGLGAVARRFGWLSQQADRTLATLTANVLIPALFFDRILTSDAYQSLGQAWQPPVVGLACTLAGYLLALVAVKLIGRPLGLVDDSQRRAFVSTVGICNYGYIPFPLAEQFFAPAVAVTLAIHNVGVDMAMWTAGIFIVAGAMKNAWWRLLISPPLLAVFVSLLIKQLGIAPYVPAPVMQMSKQLGVCAIPMGLVLSGAIIIDHLKHAQWRSGTASLVLAVLLRQGLLPALLLCIAKYIPLSHDLKAVILLQAAMPAATFPLVLVHLHKQDLPTALRVVVGTSLLGIVTIPIWLTVGAQWLGIKLN